MGKLKADLLHGFQRAGLILLLAGGSELASQGIQYFSGHNVSPFIDKALIMAVLGYGQKFLSAQLSKEEAQ